MRKAIPFIMIGLIATMPALGQKTKNLLRDRPYTYWPEPDYYHTKDDADTIQLTDGGNMFVWVSRIICC